VPFTSTSKKPTTTAKLSKSGLKSSRNLPSRKNSPMMRASIQRTHSVSRTPVYPLSNRNPQPLMSMNNNYWPSLCPGPYFTPGRNFDTMYNSEPNLCSSDYSYRNNSDYSYRNNAQYSYRNNANYSYQNNAQYPQNTSRQSYYYDGYL